MYSQDITKTAVEKLHRNGVHFVLCRAKKTPIATAWQKRPAPLAAVLKHRAAGGLLGFVPAKSGLWILDVDKFPDGNADIGPLLARVGVVPLVTVKTQRAGGVHLYFKLADGKVLENR